jgi:nucleotide-binding universal stress UspA family protein
LKEAGAVEAPRRALSISVKKILLATDFSEASRAALPYVRAIASHYKSEVYVVHVVGSGVFSLLPLREQEKALHEAEQGMRGFLQSGLGSSPRWKHFVKGGEASDVLYEFGKELDIDLLVLGTNGRRGLKRFVLGSVAEEIFRRVPCPVLTVGPKARRKMPQEVRLRHILFATDLAPSSLEALPCAIQLAKEYKAPLTVLHVAKTKKRGREVEVQLAALIPPKRKLQLKHDLLVLMGSPVSTILRTAGNKPSDLIVLGVRSGGTWDRAATHAPGPVAYNVIAQAPCPVLTLRSQRTTLIGSEQGPDGAALRR